MLCMAVGLQAKSSQQRMCLSSIITTSSQTLPIPLQGFTSADEPPPPSLSGIQLLWNIKVKSLCPPHTDMDFCGPLLELCAKSRNKSELLFAITRSLGPAPSCCATVAPAI